MPIFLSEPKNTSTTKSGVNLTFGTVEAVDALYVRGKNLSNYSPVGFGDQSRLASGFSTDIPIADGGYQHDFYEFTEDMGALSLTFQNSNFEIDKAHLMKKLFEFDDDETFTKMEMDRIERGMILQESIYNDISKVKGSFKRRVSYTAERQSRDTIRKFELFMDANTHFYFLEDYDYFPQRLYPAFIESVDLKQNYSIPYKGEGLNLDFVVSER